MDPRTRKDATMIDCADYRRAMLADPRDAAPELRAHLEDCRECPAYTERLLRFEGRLERALRIERSRRSGTPFRARPRVHRGWLAMAASVLARAGGGGRLWLAAPHPSLAADVVAHMAGEPEAWARTDEPVPAPELEPVLRDAHMRLKPDGGHGELRQSCLFRGHHVPHLVVQTDLGPVTVMVLVHDSVRSPSASTRRAIAA